jgi:hypothetical protein
MTCSFIFSFEGWIVKPPFWDKGFRIAEILRRMACRVLAIDNCSLVLD